MSRRDIGLIYTTFGNVDDAATLCQTLVQEGHARCANILAPHRSVYGWKGRVETAEETGVLLKCAAAKTDALMQVLKKRHPYKTPAIILLSAEAEAAFAGWLEGEE